jgi:hypothetical protein
MDQSTLEKLVGPQLVQKFPAFYGNRMFITAFTKACRLSLSWASSIQFVFPLYSTSCKFLVFQVVSFPQIPYQNPECISPLPHICCVPAHLNPSDFITRKKIFGEYSSQRSSLRGRPHCPVNSSLSGPNSFLSTLYSKTLSLSSERKTKIFKNVGLNLKHRTNNSTEKFLEMKPSNTLLLRI